MKRFFSSLLFSLRRTNPGFTLVELIVVITILAILATIGFFSLQGYSSRSRDSVRITAIALVSKGLDVYSATAGSYPIPDNQYGTGTVGGTNVSIAGNIDSRIAGMIQLDTAPKDPIGGNKLAYGVDINMRQYQLAGTLEEGSPISASDFIVQNAYAASTNSNRAYVRGQYAGLIRANNTVFNVPTLLFVNTGIVDQANANTRPIIDGAENVPYTLNSSSNGTLTPTDALAKAGSTATTVTGVAITDWNTQSGTVATTLGYSAEKVGIAYFGTKDYAAKYAPIPSATGSGNTAPGWTVAGGGDCALVTNTLGTDGNTSTCVDPRTYTMQWGATHDKTYSLIKISGNWWFNENLAYPVATGYQGNGSWSTTDLGYYSCPGNDGTTTSNCSLVATRWYLYQWSAAMAGWASTNNTSARAQGICPSGWAIPTFVDFTTSGSAYWPAGDTWSAGGNTVGWLKTYPGTRTNDTNGTFSNAGAVENLWISLEDGAMASRVVWTNSSNSTATKTNGGKANGLTVRCIKN